MNMFISGVFITLGIFFLYLLVDYIHDTVEITRHEVDDYDKARGDYGVTYHRIILWFVTYEVIVRFIDLCYSNFIKGVL